MYSMGPYGDGMQGGFLPFWNRDLLDAAFGYREHGGFRATVREREDAYELCAELPGVDPKQIAVSVERGRLTVAADIEDIHQQSDGYIERQSEHYQRSFAFDGIDEDAVTARARHGLLVVVLPKIREEGGARARRIEVQ